MPAERKHTPEDVLLSILQHPLRKRLLRFYVEAEGSGLAFRRPSVADIYRGKRTNFPAPVVSMAAARPGIAPPPSPSPWLC